MPWSNRQRSPPSSSPRPPIDQPRCSSPPRSPTADTPTRSRNRPAARSRPDRAAAVVQLSPAVEFPLAAAHQRRIEELPGGAGIKVEEHEGQVTWYAPIELTAGVDPKSLEIRGTIHMQVCQNRGICEPVEKEFVAKQAAAADAASNLPLAVCQSAIGNEIPQSATGSFSTQRLRCQARRPNRSRHRPARRIGRARDHRHARPARHIYAHADATTSRRHEAGAHCH